MPYRKSYKKKKSYRPGYLSCGKMVLSDAGKALKIAASLKRLVNVEIKHHDVTLTAQTMGTAPSIVQLTNIPRGDTTLTRDGSQCKVLAVELAFIIQRPATSTTSACRIMLVCDKQTNQAVYVNTDLLHDVTINDNIVSPYNLDNKYRFVVLFDRVFHFSSGSNGSVSYKRTFRMSKILRFDAAAADITDLTSNSLSFVQMGNESTNLPIITLSARVRFVDN
jgi:hypothetical protein